MATLTEVYFSGRKAVVSIFRISGRVENSFFAMGARGDIQLPAFPWCAGMFPGVVME